MSLRVGRFILHEIRDAVFAIDGGVLFGPAPRTEWGSFYPPDADNRVTLMSRLLLIDAGKRKILVDTGLGDKLSPEEQAVRKVDRSCFDLDRELARAGMCREAVTDVILTHLHRAHAGGTTRRAASGAIELAFPQATFHLQRRQFRSAHHPTERDAPNFCRDDFALLEQCGRLHLCEGETELFEGVQVLISEGHAVGMQLVHLESEDGEMLCAGDLVPTLGHLKVSWQETADLYPLAGIDEKKMLLAQALESNTLLFLPHEPAIAACRLREVEGGVEPGEIVAF